MGDHTLGGRYFKQVYRPTTGKAIGQYQDGSVAAVENNFGKGKTILIGTFPGASYFKKPNPESRAVFQSLLSRKQQVTVSDSLVIARMHQGTGGTYLWVVNPTRENKTVSINLDSRGWRSAKDVWGSAGAQVNDDAIRVTVPERDAAVLRLEK